MFHITLISRVWRVSRASLAGAASEFHALIGEILIASLLLLGVGYGAQAQDLKSQDLKFGRVELSEARILPGGALRVSTPVQVRRNLSDLVFEVSLLRNGSDRIVARESVEVESLKASKAFALKKTLQLPNNAPRGDYRVEIKAINALTSQTIAVIANAGNLSVVGANGPLPYQTVTRLSAYDMIDAMGVVAGIGWQRHPESPNNPWDLPNRNGEKESIEALQYLGIRHIRNEGLQIDPHENADRPAPGTGAPNDFDNFMTMRRAMPNLKILYLIRAGAPTDWDKGTIRDPKPVLTKLARMGALAGIEAPNEPNFQATFSPAGVSYTPPKSEFSDNVNRYNQIWTDWGRAMAQLKASDPAFANVPLLPPSSGVWGPNGPDGVERFYARSGLTDHTAFYDLMNIHSYGPSGLTLGDPRGDIASGNPPTWGAYQVSIPNWGRYAMPGRPVMITESGSNTRRVPPPAVSASEQAQALAILNNFYWAKYYGAVRLYQYALVDDSTDLNDAQADRWGMYRGDWSKKPAADLIHRFTRAIADEKQSDPAQIPAFAIEGKNSRTWGAEMALSKSDGSFFILCNNVLSWWDPKSGADLTPSAEQWTIKLDRPAKYEIIDVKAGTTSAPQTAQAIAVSVQGYPMIVHVQPEN